MVPNSQESLKKSNEFDTSELDKLQRVSTLSLVSFGMAICIHSLIEGMAMGIFDEIGSITILAISIVIHKVPVAISVGAAFKT